MDLWRRIFEFDYQREMYKPVAKPGGYFALPILYGDPLAGKPASPSAPGLSPGIHRLTSAYCGIW